LDPGRLPPGPTTRFAPAPTGYLHLGHVANALWVWGAARSAAGRVVLRIEDHDRQRSRPSYESAILEDLDWLGFIAEVGPVRQSDSDGQAAYGRARARLAADGRIYGCDCTRSTFARWAAAHGQPWVGPGCPGSCRGRRLGTTAGTLRVDLGDGTEAWDDLLAGPCVGPVAPAGDLVVRDRHGSWTYGFCVVVDDLRQVVDLIVRGRDLLHATPTQIRLARLLGRPTPPVLLHHPLIRRPDGSKLSKSAGDTGVRELRAAGHSPAVVVGMAVTAMEAAMARSEGQPPAAAAVSSRM
jgi:glutamyl/glutaminyl-tRNA synthetase